MCRNLIATLMLFVAAGGFVFGDKKGGKPRKPVFDLAGRLESADAKKRTITVTFKSLDKKGGPAVKTLALAKDAEITIDDGKAGTFEDLANSKVVFLNLSADKTAARKVHGHGPTVQGSIKAVDPAAGTVTLAVIEKKGEPPASKALPVSKKAILRIDGGLDKKEKGRVVGLGDFVLGLQAAARLSVDQTAVLSLHARAPSVQGTVKALDAARRQVTIAGGKGRKEASYTLADKATVVLDDMTGEKSSHGKGKIEDVRVGTRVDFQLTLDGNRVAHARVSGPEYHGVLKAITDGRLTVNVFHSKTEPGEDRTFNLAESVRVHLTEPGQKGLSQGAVSDLKAGMPVHVRLGADLKTIGSIRAAKR